MKTQSVKSAPSPARPPKQRARSDEWERTTGRGGSIAFNHRTHEVQLTGNFAVGLSAIAKRYGVTLQSLFRVILGQYVDDVEQQRRK